MTSPTTILAAHGLRKVFHDGDKTVAAVDRVDFEVNEGEFYTLLGPSGCGKTTTLRLVAGLEIASAGRIVVGGSTVSDTESAVFVPAHRRDIGMVFQSYGIWPHMSVFENAAFPLRVSKRRHSKRDIQQRVEEALATVQLAGYEGRNATALSGGQQQRLALARALVRRPKILLLDEPLSNLDAKLRDAMREELASLQQRLGLTTLYVTHDQGEALSMSTRIAVMDSGRISQEGPPRRIYHRPTTRFVAAFVGRTNFLAGSVRALEADAAIVETNIGDVAASCPSRTAAGDRVEVTIRPETVHVHLDHPGPRANIYPARVDRTMFLGESMDCHVRIGDIDLLAEIPAWTDVDPGQDVWVEFPRHHCVVLADGEPHGSAPADASTPTADGAPASSAELDVVARFP